MMNKEKVIKKTKDDIRTGYLDDDGNFILHSFDDEPAKIFTNSGTKNWYEDNKIHRDNNKPVIISSDVYKLYYKNGKRYWFINGTEYHSYEEVIKKFKNNILKLKNINMKILKDNGIVDAINLYRFGYLILDQSQYNSAILKFI